jgi:hypothetical protein
MAMNTVTNYTCDRCGRSEIKDGVTILTMTIRPRAGKGVQGLGKPDVSAHVCRDNCLKIIKASMTPVGCLSDHCPDQGHEQDQGCYKGRYKEGAYGPYEQDHAYGVRDYRQHSRGHCEGRSSHHTGQREVRARIRSRARAADDR